jgi:hypothetical protein
MPMASFSWRSFILSFREGEVKFHFILVFGLKFADFQFNRRKTPQFPMVEQKVDKVFLVVDSQLELIPDKSKLRPHFKQEGAHIVYQRRFKLPPWPGGWERLFAVRDYDIRDGSGVPIVRGRSFWLILDIVKRRPLWP